VPALAAGVVVYQVGGGVGSTFSIFGAIPAEARPPSQEVARRQRRRGIGSYSPSVAALALAADHFINPDLSSDLVALLSAAARRRESIAKSWQYGSATGTRLKWRKQWGPTGCTIRHSGRIYDQAMKFQRP
jgi:hypothetical protein